MHCACRKTSAMLPFFFIGAKMENVELVSFDIVRNIKKGEYIKCKPDSKTVYIKGEYCRTTKKFELIDTNDINRFVYVKGNKICFYGFTY
jgi:hypothetical protein